MEVMMKENYNVVLTSLSVVRKNDKIAIDEKLDLQSSYYEKGKKLFNAYLSNEASVKFIQQNLNAREDTIDGLFYIKTEATEKYIDDLDKKTHTDIILNQLRLATGLSDNQFYTIDDVVPDEPSSTYLLKLSTMIADKIFEIKDKDAKGKKFNLYIDSNGGFRDLILVVVAILNTLKQEDIHIRQVVGINYFPQEKRGNILDKTKAYSIYDLYSGIDEFVNYGRSTIIDKFFNKTIGTDILTESMKNVLNQINEMSDAFSLCRPKAMIKTTLSLKQSIEYYETSLSNDTKENVKDIFNFFCNRIKNEYQDIFNHLNEENDIDQFETLQVMIVHCLNHQMIQQALTLYSELIPGILYNHRLFYENKTHQSNFDEFYQSTHSYSKGYVFIQQYLRSNELNSYFKKDCSKKKQVYKKCSTPIDWVEEYMNKKFIMTNFIKYKNRLLAIIEHYYLVKDYRNSTNHANDGMDGNITISKLTEDIKMYLKEIEWILKTKK